MKVVHICATPLAGSPIRIVNALNKHTDVKARLINLDPHAYGTRTFPEDLIWDKDRAGALALIADADILHFHHWFDFASTDNPFSFNFVAAMKKGAGHLMHWHTNPMAIAKNTGQSVESIVQAAVPQMVVAQFHESYYPNARPVPLIVSVEDEKPAAAQREKPVVFYSPSTPFYAFEKRWETKAKPEILALLEKLKAQGILDYTLVQDKPFDECAAIRNSCDIVIDDLVTGSFHTTSLEALAAGKPTMAYLDPRTQMVLATLTGATDLPLVNVRLEDAAAVLNNLCGDKALRENLASYARAWMSEFYSEKIMIAHYTAAYKDLIATGRLENPRYAKDRAAKSWLYNIVPDLIWDSRKSASASRFKRRISLSDTVEYVRTVCRNLPYVGIVLQKFNKLLTGK